MCVCMIVRVCVNVRVTCADVSIEGRECRELRPRAAAVSTCRAGNTGADEPVAEV